MNAIESAIQTCPLKAGPIEKVVVTYRQCSKTDTSLIPLAHAMEALSGDCYVWGAWHGRLLPLDLFRRASNTPKANWKPTNRSPKKLARLKHSLTQSTIQKYATICSHR